MGSSFINIGSGWPSHLSSRSFSCHTEMRQKRWCAQVAFFWLSCVVLDIPPPPPALFFSSVLRIVIVCNAKGWPKDVSNGERPYREEHLWQRKLCQDRVMAIAHQQKRVAGNAETIIGNVADEPTSGRQWYQKGPSGQLLCRTSQVAWLLSIKNYSRKAHIGIYVGTQEILSSVLSM